MFKSQNKNQPRQRRPIEPQAKTARVFSYYASRSPRESAPHGNAQPSSQARTNFWQKLPVMLSLVAIGIAFLYLLSMVPSARLAITNDSQLVRPVDVYQRYADEVLRDSPLNRFKLTFNSDRIAERMMSRFPELGRVSVTVPLISHRPIMQIYSKQAAFILESGSEQYYIGYDGRAVAKAQDIPPLPETLTVIDQSNVPLLVGQQVLPKNLVDFITMSQAQLRAAKVKTTSLILPASVNELHVRLAGEPYFVKFYTLGDARLQVGTFLALKKQLAEEGITVKEYIDVRVEERAYYR